MSNTHPLVSTPANDNLAALEHLRLARAIAAGLDMHSDWVRNIDHAIYTELVCLSEDVTDQAGLTASTVLEWAVEYSVNEEFPWLSKIRRAVDLLDDSIKLGKLEAENE